MEHFESLFNSTYNGGFKVKHVLGKKAWLESVASLNPERMTTLELQC